MEELELLVGECTAETKIQYNAEDIQCRLRLAGHRDQFSWEGFVEAVQASCSSAKTPGRSDSAMQADMAWTAAADSAIDIFPVLPTTVTPDCPGNKLSHSAQQTPAEGDAAHTSQEEGAPLLQDVPTSPCSTEGPRRASAFPAESAEPSKAGIRLHAISKTLGRESVLDVKLGRKPPEPKDFGTVAKAAMNHERFVLTSMCERSAIEVFKTMPRSEFY